MHNCKLAIIGRRHYARREIVVLSEVGIYHCFTRCVRRAFLCGQDPLTGQNFDYRKSWIRERLEELAGMLSPLIFLAL